MVVDILAPYSHSAIRNQHTGSILTMAPDQSYYATRISLDAWWRHLMETFSALLAICAGNSPVSGELPAQRPVTQSFDVFFDLCPNKRLSKQPWGWWFETPSVSLWRHSNGPLDNRYSRMGCNPLIPLLLVCSFSHVGNAVWHGHIIQDDI